MDIGGTTDAYNGLSGPYNSQSEQDITEQDELDWVDPYSENNSSVSQ